MLLLLRAQGGKYVRLLSQLEGVLRSQGVPEAAAVVELIYGRVRALCAHICDLTGRGGRRGGGIAM